VIVQSNWALPETLKLLAASGDAELVAEIIDMFKSDTARRLLLLREALAQMDGKRVKQQAHAIKGSAIQVGADSLAALCQRIEQKDPARSCPELETLVRQAEADFEGLCRA
jgi:HPt (histidine-containing phosphotransfer) domain-containing protein